MCCVKCLTVPAVTNTENNESTMMSLMARMSVSLASERLSAGGGCGQ